MKSVIAVSAFECRMWDLHDRLEMLVTEEACRAEIESFRKHGQLIPALARPLVRDPTHKFELIYGARRLFVARHLNVPLLIEPREMTDTEAIVAMDIENRQRSDISAYERGLSYARWLRAGLFSSQDEIVRTLKVSAAHVSRLLKLAQLPSVIVGAFESPAALCEGWGLEIAQALEDPQRRESTIRVARAMNSISPRLPAREVYRRLRTATTRGRRTSARGRAEVVKGRIGSPLFRIHHQSSGIAFVLSIEKARPEVVRRVRQALTEILEASAGIPQTLNRAENGTRPSVQAKPAGAAAPPARIALEP